MRFYREYSSNTRFIDINTSARRSWLDFKVFKRGESTHIVWGRLSVHWGAFDCVLCRDTGELPSGDWCEHCCEHGEYDHGICYTCGKDCLDDLIGQAEYYFEGER